MKRQTTLPCAGAAVLLLAAGLVACGNTGDAGAPSSSGGSGGGTPDAGPGAPSDAGGADATKPSDTGTAAEASTYDGTTPPGDDAGSAPPDAACTSDASDPGPNPTGMPLRPFPQHVGYPGCSTCIHPSVAQSQMDSDVQAFYDGWKAKLIMTFAQGDVTGESYISAGANGAINGWPAGVNAITQSEGHGYAMLITALMAGHDPNAKKTFDSLDRVRKAFPSSSDPRLMSWALPSDGKTSDAPQPPATDGDMDMAYALLLAYSQWGDEANNHYLAEASSVIAGMEAKFVTSGVGMYFPRLNIGDPNHLGSAPPESKPYMTRPSDFMIDHMLTFRSATGHAVWGDVANGSANILLAVRNPNTGLVPDFVVDDPPVPSTTGTADENLCYQCFDFNSCRVPWRQSVAVAQYGFAGSKDVASKMMSWARTKYGDMPASMKAVFNLDGTGGTSGNDPAFTSPMVAAGITDPAAQQWLDRGWVYMTGVDSGSYYGGSITLMSMILVSGNWWIPGPAACP